MSIHLQVYGNLDPIYFKITKSAVAVASLTFSTGDIALSIDGGAWANIDTEVTEMIGAGLGKGWYVWQPTLAAQTQGKVFIINVKEITGTNFDENGLAISTGGDASARFSG